MQHNSSFLSYLSRLLVVENLQGTFIKNEESFLKQEVLFGVYDVISLLMIIFVSYLSSSRRQINDSFQDVLRHRTKSEILEQP